MAEVMDPIVHELLRDLRALTSQQFIYEDPWHGYVPYDGAPTDCQIGPPLSFTALDRRDKTDVLEFIRWDYYRDKGLDWRDQRAIENNIGDGKPPHRWLEGTTFLDPSLRAERREELIQETFDLSRKIGYAHFRAENFDRPDPALVRLSPPEREAFLQEWWDAARERMYASYLEQVAGLSNEALARNREAYQEAMAAGSSTGNSEKTPDRPAGENPSQSIDACDTLCDKLFGPARFDTRQAEPPSQPEKDENRGTRTTSLRAKLFGEAAETGQQGTDAPGMVHFKGFLCEMQWKTYPNGRAALYLVDAQTRETVAVATADLPDAPLKPGEVFIKDHSENRGMLAALEQAGVVKATGAAVRSDFAEVPVAALLPGHGREAGGESPRSDDAQQKTGAEPQPPEHQRRH
jgi:hypothetical protein